MRILHIIDEPYDSGITGYALDAAQGLAERGHPTWVWGRLGAPPLREARVRGLETAGASRPWLGLPSLRRLLRDEGIELAVAHSGVGHTLALAAAAALRGAPAVVRTRGDARSLRRRPGSRILWKRTAGFIAANERILGDFRKAHPSWAAPSAVIYQGQEDPGPPPPPKNGALTIGIVGRLDPVKGHGDFLEAAALVRRRFPDVRFLIVGRQQNVKAEELRRKASRLGLASALELTGHVPDVAPWMSRCHIGVVASVGSEAVSRAAVEWMAAGRPLVATAVGCLPEYVAPEATGFLVPPRSAPALASRLELLVSDLILRERMGRAGRRRYEELFTLRRFLDATESFYERALNALPSR